MQPPELSVVIATHNRHQMLRRCLDALATQTADPATFEVIVADDASSDGTPEVVEGLTTPYSLRLLRLSKHGQAGAQNAGIEAAAGIVCLTLDDDVIASPTLIAAHLEAHREDPRTIGVGALTQAPISEGDWFARSVARGWAEHYENLAGRPARWTDCFGANVSFPRQALLDAGGIATDLDVAFDFDIALRLCQRGCVPRFLPEAHGIHDDKGKGTRGMLRDAARQGAMHVELSRRYPDRAEELLNWRLGPRTERLFRRLALACKVHPVLLAAPGHLLPGDGRKMIWLHFVRRLAFWGGVREAVTKPEWKQLTHAPDRRTQLAMASPFGVVAVAAVEKAPL
ncbi:MAG TPA: glycosyltransferase family 2 protein [Solirubrobacterales bacterium]|nr:glycosyltransferase family 2 protein [Solirubrobacterales bacterium]